MGGHGAEQRLAHQVQRAAGGGQQPGPDELRGLSVQHAHQDSGQVQVVCEMHSTW